MIVVLNSGGVDTAALFELLPSTSSLSRSSDDTSVFVDYGQRAARKERKAAGILAREYGYNHINLTLHVPSWRFASPLKKNFFSVLDEPCVVVKGRSRSLPLDGGWRVPGRNLMLLVTALSEIERRRLHGLVHLNVAFRDGSGAPDQTSKFIAYARSALSSTFSNSLTIEAPILDRNKRQVLSAYYLSNCFQKIGYFAWSCENDGPRHCGVCRNCVELRQSGQELPSDLFMTPRQLKRFSGLDVEYIG